MSVNWNSTTISNVELMPGKSSTCISTIDPSNGALLGTNDSNTGFGGFV